MDVRPGPFHFRGTQSARAVLQKESGPETLRKYWDTAFRNFIEKYFQHEFRACVRKKMFVIREE